MYNLLYVALVGAGIYFGYNNVNTTADVSALDWIKSLVGVLGGTGLLVNENFSKIKGWLLGLLNSAKENKNLSIKNMEQIGEKLITISKNEYILDMENLKYITERVGENAEAKELCRKLHDYFFNLHHNEKKESTK